MGINGVSFKTSVLNKAIFYYEQPAQLSLIDTQRLRVISQVMQSRGSNYAKQRFGKPVQSRIKGFCMRHKFSRFSILSVRFMVGLRDHQSETLLLSPHSDSKFCDK